MGRGRAKAKQTKVARQLKYNSGGTDLERLRAEILGEPDHDGAAQDEPDEPDDPYAQYVEDDDEDDAPYEGNGHRYR
jgi:hypothetical protein